MMARIDGQRVPLCGVPAIAPVLHPLDGGQYLFTHREMEDFLQTEPGAAKYFRPWYGAKEFLHRAPRYFLWLGDATSLDLYRLPECRKRMDAVEMYRRGSANALTRKWADRPAIFPMPNRSCDDYLIIPRRFAAKQGYVPMGFLRKTTFCDSSVYAIPDATPYHFGVLSSSVHMAWVKAVCGQQKGVYRYSKEIAYNSFSVAVGGHGDENTD